MSPKDAILIRSLRLVRFFAYIVVVIGITAASVGYQVAQQQEAHVANTKHWEQAEGQVIESAVDEAGDKSATVLYSPNVLVMFSVGETQYEADRVYRSDKSTLTSERREDVESVIRPYVSGSVVPVHYDPVNPANAVLSLDIFPGFDSFRPIRLNPAGVLIAGAGLAIAGLVLVRLVSSIVRLVMKKYEAFVGNPAHLTTSALQEFYPGLESAKFFQARSSG